MMVMMSLKRFLQTFGLLVVALTLFSYEPLHARKDQDQQEETTGKKKKNRKKRKNKKKGNKKRSKKNKRGRKGHQKHDRKHHRESYAKKYEGIHKLSVMSGSLNDTMKQLDAIIREHKRVIVKFTTWWCHNCTAMETTDAEVIRQFKADGVTFVKVQVGGMRGKAHPDFVSPEFERVYGHLRGVPKYLFFSDGVLSNAHEEYGTITLEHFRELVNQYVLKK